MTLNGLIIDKKMLLLINKIGNERLENLSTTDFLIIDALFHERTMNDNMLSRLKHLIDMGIVEHVGRNKYVLSRNLYSVAGKAGMHTRVVGLDRETNKELLFKHIHDSGESGSPFKELQQVLPSLSRSQIQPILKSSY